MRLVSVLAALLMVSPSVWAAQTRYDAKSPRSLAWTEPEKRIVLIVPNFELVTIKLGPNEPHQDWTAAGKLLLIKQIAARLAASGIDLVVAEPDNAVSLDPHEYQLIKLHSAITTFGEAHPEGSESGAKDVLDEWTLGPGATAFRDHYHVDYALFVYGQDKYETAGHVASVAGAIALGILVAGAGGGPGPSPSPPRYRGPDHTANASLVDVRTGKILWGNSTDEGGFKDEQNARKTVESLFSGSPL